MSSDYPQCPDSFSGPLSRFLDLHVAPALPSPAKLLEWHLAVKRWASEDRQVLIVRMFAKHRLRGQRWAREGLPFTVSDNEAALWSYMECFDGKPAPDFSRLVAEQSFPISYAWTKQEVKDGRPWRTVGRCRRGTAFALARWKHCHLIDASPRGKSPETAAELRRRALCLLSPLNHAPMPSPRRFSMVRDWGEDLDTRAFIAMWMRRRLGDAAASEFDALHGELRAQPRDVEIRFSAKSAAEIVSLLEPAANEPTKEFISSADSVASFFKGEELGDFSTLVARLRSWLDETDEETIGNGYGGAAWVRFPLGGVECELNSDAARAGVERFLELCAEGGVPISVGTTNTGKIRKLLFRGAAITRFPAYTKNEQRREVELGVYPKSPTP